MKMQSTLRGMALALMAAILVMGTVGCAADDDPALAIIGVYSDNYGGSHTITANSWTSGFAGSDPSVYNILSYDNSTKVVIAQNAATNAYFPSLYSRIDWANSAGKLYYCSTAYAAESEQAARDTTAADATDPAVGGCGTSPWTELKAQ